MHILLTARHFTDIIIAAVGKTDAHEKKIEKRGLSMKSYLKRIFAECPKHRMIIWWIFRALMIFAFIKGFFPAEGEAFDITDPLQVGANFLCMFVWEVFMLLPEKNALRHVPSVVQTFLIIGIFAASFGGKFMNFYYDLQYWDTILHLIGGGACVFFGYEIATAMQKRDKATAPLSLVLLAAVGFSFLASTGWELFEFTFDQIACKSAFAAGDILKAGDAQHWSLTIAQAAESPKVDSLFNPYFPERWALMDTMADIILNTIGALIAIIAIKIYPYRHKGKFKTELD